MENGKLFRATLNIFESGLIRGDLKNLWLQKGGLLEMEGGGA